MASCPGQLDAGGCRCLSLIRMASRWLLITASLLVVVTGRTIKDEIVQRQELSETHRYLQNLSMWNFLGFEQQTYTFFAPVNGAYQNIPGSVHDELQSASSSDSAKQTVNEMFLNHGVFGQRVMSTDIVTGSTATSMAQGAKLFFRDIKGEKFVNGARFNRSDIICDNGVLHVVDIFMYQEMKNKPAFTVIDEMKNIANPDESTRYFVQLLNTYKNEPQARAYWPLNGLDGVFITTFVPSDRTFEPLIAANPNFMRDLENNKDELIKVVESHVIGGDASAVYHSSVLHALGDLHERIDAYQGSVVPKFFHHQLYVSNNCSQGRITGANITVNNGVIHIIDGILGFLRYDIFQLLSHNPDLSEMKTFAEMASPDIQNILDVMGNTSAPLVASEKYTLFAPINDAFDALQQLLVGNISQDRADIDNLFQFHLLEAEVKHTDMTNTTRYRTLHGSDEARFYIDLDGTTWVEVNHVRGRIVRADYCVTNGIVHFVDHVLGIALYTVYEAIQQKDNLRELAQSIRTTGLNTYLDDTNKQFTFFAPTDNAFAIMRGGVIGRYFLEDYFYLRGLMHRHHSTETYWLSNITSSRTICNGAGSDFTIRRLPDQSFIIDYQGKEIHVLMHDEKMLNGNLNIIDAVIYRETRHDLGLADHLNSECPADSGTQGAGTPRNTSNSDGVASDSEVIMFSPGVFVCVCVLVTMFVRTI